MSRVSAKILLKHGIIVPLPLLSPSPITYITYSAILRQLTFQSSSRMLSSENKHIQKYG